MCLRPSCQSHSMNARRLSMSLQGIMLNGAATMLACVSDHCGNLMKPMFSTITWVCQGSCWIQPLECWHVSLIIATISFRECPSLSYGSACWLVCRIMVMIPFNKCFSMYCPYEQMGLQGVMLDTAGGRLDGTWEAGVQAGPAMYTQKGFRFSGGFQQGLPSGPCSFALAASASQGLPPPAAAHLRTLGIPSLRSLGAYNFTSPGRFLTAEPSWLRAHANA